MAQLKQYLIYSFDEISDKAKETARDWYRDTCMDHEWWDSVYEDAINMADILGIEIGTRGKHERRIWFRGFYSQGDGACWEGDYSYAKGALKRLQAEAPARYKIDGVWHENEDNAELHRIAKGLQDVQKRHFYQLRATSKQSGHYSHSGCMDVEVWHDEDRYRDIGDAEDDVKQLLRDFADWIYKRLEAEHDWLTSDEQVEESIRANEYTFDASGNWDCV